MPSSPDRGAGTGPREAACRATVALVAICTGIEAVLWLGETGWLGAAAQGWRSLAIAAGAFWPGVLRSEMAGAYPGQSAAMLLTYPFLHAGPGHMLGNMVALAWVGAKLERNLGAGRLVLLWLATGVLGTLSFLWSEVTAPVVGASGALFGFLGAWIGGLIQTEAGRAAAPRLLAATLGLGVVLPLLAPGVTGAMAWQIHLGGLLVGLIVGILGEKPRLSPSGP